MAISFIASATDESSSAATVTAAEPTGTAQNDLVILYGTIHVEDGSWTDPADFTEIANTVAGANVQNHAYLGYKIRGATAGETLTLSYSGTDDDIRGTALTFRGIDTSTPIDVTYVEGSHYAFYNADQALTAAPPITTVTNNAWAVLLQWTTDADITAGMPTGYTERFFAEAGGGDRTQIVASKAVAVAGTETPGAWTHTDISSSHDQVVYTIAIRPAVAAGAAKLSSAMRLFM